MKNNLMELRKEKGYSQDSLATKLNVSRQTIISIEKGRYNPSLPLALVLARIFNKPVEDIFTLESKDLKKFMNEERRGK
ncbi:helix-turn-helix transcriptional regulator [Amphibacillus sp. Q70]|uniref:helix-turn-helix transcriptional regulator n=1 Tax=Amphibacillus sp. Q70 TaxID=3453416 RepID=UPI003F871E27